MVNPKRVTCACGQAYTVFVLPLVCSCGNVNTTGVDTVVNETVYSRPVFIAPVKEVPINGVGYYLAQLLSPLKWVVKSSGCGCDERAAQLDYNGIDWCRTNIPIILDWLKEGAKANGLPFNSAVARCLIKRAIHLAEKNSKNLSKLESARVLE